MEIEGVCEFLAWDSNFFGFPIGKVIGDTLSPSQADEIESWCRQNKIRCLYFLASSNDPDTISTAEEHGYQLVDIRMTLARCMSQGLPSKRALPEGAGIRPSTLADLEVLKQISSQSFRASRFYFDTKFPTMLSDQLYEIWIEKSLKAYADRVFVTTNDEIPSGFIVCRLESGAKKGHISLIGINPHYRGQGLSKTLILTALAWFKAQEVDEVLVVTQGRNIIAQRLYQGFGFQTHDVHLWYHKWYHS